MGNTFSNLDINTHNAIYGTKWKRPNVIIDYDHFKNKGNTVHLTLDKHSLRIDLENLKKLLIEKIGDLYIGKQLENINKMLTKEKEINDILDQINHLQHELGIKNEHLNISIHDIISSFAERQKLEEDRVIHLHK